MKISTPEISWHERDPIYTCAFHPIKKNKFATAGVTGSIRLWEIADLNRDKVTVKFLANLNRHTKAVNSIRWNHDGLTLASAGDEGAILLWNENEIKNQKTLDTDDDESIENWFAFKNLRGHLEDVLDLCWSKDSSVLISGSIDNSAILWDVASGNKLAILKEPKGFVQGVAYDPLGQFYAVISTDRSLRYYSTTSNKCIYNVNKMVVNKETAEQNNIRLFYDDTMKSFFRRICFSFDGNLLFAPAGCLEFKTKPINASYIFTRNCLNKPCVYIPHDKPSIAVAVCPLRFKLIPKDSNDENKKNTANLFALPYRLVFSIATEDSVFFYDTQHVTPFAYATGMHFSNLTDLSWMQNGTVLAVSSIDGFCTFITFDENELGELYIEEPKVIDANEIKASNTKSETKLPAQNTIKTLFTNYAAKTAASS